MPYFRATRSWPNGFRTRVGSKKMVFRPDTLTEVAEHLADAYVRCYLGEYVEEVESPVGTTMPPEKPAVVQTPAEPPTEPIPQGPAPTDEQSPPTATTRRRRRSPRPSRGE